MHYFWVLLQWYRMWQRRGLPVSISQKAKQDALEHADIIDSLKKGSVAIRKYDMTAAQAAGDYSEDMYVATGEKRYGG